MRYDSAQQKALFELSKQLLKKEEIPQKAIAQTELADLQQVINYHEWRYYVLDDPTISDFEYDQLFKRLKTLEEAYPDLITPDSPTQRVGSDLGGVDFLEVAHLTPMLSLDNSYDAEDLKDFDERVKKLVGLAANAEVAYCVEPKFDGGTIALIYENDQLVRGATRGNGEKGEDITHNARAIRTIPLQASFSQFGIQKVELRGEVIIQKDRFRKVNETRLEAGKSILANPRNAATGALRVKDSTEVTERALEAFVYQVGYAIKPSGKDKLPDFQTHDDTIEMLGKLGFKIPTQAKSERKICQNIAEVIEFCQAWQERRDNYDYEIDGMVVKVNSLALQEKCGYTSHHPRWAIAFKFKAKQATSKLVSIEYQVGKVGSITPVAKIEPVALAGVTVSSISLHNEDFIRSKDIRLGDTVLVERAGDVIPYIVKPMEELRTGTEAPIIFPTACPVCSTALEKPESEAVWRCPNYHCEAQVLQRMIHHVSKDAMDIDGFGKSYVERFYALGWLKDISDIYRLDYQALAALEGFGQKSADNLRNAIEKAKNNPLHRLLYSLSIHHLGKKVSKLLAAEIQHVLDLKNWQLENYTEIKDVGPVVANNVMHFFEDKQNLELLQQLEILGVNVRQTEADQPELPATEGVFVGKTILFTGKLEQMTREEAQQKAKNLGAKLLGAVSANLDILVVGEKAGSKLKKAQALGTVQILTEAEFLALAEQS